YWTGLPQNVSSPIRIWVLFELSQFSRHLIRMYRTGGIANGNVTSSPLSPIAMSSSLNVPLGKPEGLIDSWSTNLLHPSKLPSGLGSFDPQISYRLNVASAK